MEKKKLFAGKNESGAKEDINKMHGLECMQQMFLFNILLY